MIIITDDDDNDDGDGDDDDHWWSLLIVVVIQTFLPEPVIPVGPVDDLRSDFSGVCNSSVTQKSTNCITRNSLNGATDKQMWQMQRHVQQRTRITT